MNFQILLLSNIFLRGWVIFLIFILFFYILDCLAGELFWAQAIEALLALWIFCKHVEFEYIAVLSTVAFGISPMYYSRPNQELSLLSWTP